MNKLEMMKRYSKKQWRKLLLWRMRVTVMKRNQQQQQHSKFQYDPSSYALNFDDGGAVGEGRGCSCCVLKVKGWSIVEGCNGGVIIWVSVDQLLCSS
ncbi:hypothetical protein LINPERPRIM_LOCUS34055 [Linum perenne]